MEFFGIEKLLSIFVGSLFLRFLHQNRNSWNLVLLMTNGNIENFIEILLVTQVSFDKHI